MSVNENSGKMMAFFERKGGCSLNAAVNIIKMIRQVEMVKLRKLKRCTEEGKDSRVTNFAI